MSMRNKVIGLKMPQVMPMVGQDLIFNFYECDRTIELLNQLIEEKSEYVQSGLIGAEKSARSNDEVRKVTKVGLIELTANPDSKYDIIREMFQKIVNAVNVMNRDFDVDIVDLENIEIAKYAEDDHYDWHVDIGEFADMGPNMSRKLSFVILLNDPSEYEGGELVIGSTEDKIIEKNKEAYRSFGAGNMIMFPSYCLHKVFPVTKGERYVIYGWVLGPAWR